MGLLIAQLLSQTSETASGIRKNRLIKGMFDAKPHGKMIGKINKFS